MLVPADQLARLRMDVVDPRDVLREAPHVLEFPVVLVHHEHEAALVQVDHVVAAVARDQDGLVRRVVVPDVVRDLLPVPLERARLRIEADDAAGVEVVALAVLADPRRRIAGAVDHAVGRRVVRAGHPRAATAVLAGLAGPARRIVLDGVEGPHELAGRGVDAVDLAARREIAGRGAVREDVARHDGRRREVAAVAVLERRELRRPQFLTGLLVERDAATVDGADVHATMRDGDAAAPRGEHGLRHRRIELRLVLPDRAAGRAVHRVDHVERRCVVDDAVEHDRRRLDAVRDVAGLMDPRDLQPLHVVAVHLLQRAVAPRVVRAVVLRPVVGVVQR
jgi:hypothetical protein